MELLVIESLNSEACDQYCQLNQNTYNSGLTQSKNSYTMIALLDIFSLNYLMISLQIVMCDMVIPKESLIETQCEIIVKEKEGELQMCQEQNEKNEEMLKQLQQTLVQQFSQSLTFSTIYKNSNCSVTQNGKLIETSQSGWQCCMCDQMIPKNGLIQFAIKIIELSSIMIGIGFRDIVQSRNYGVCHNIGYGTYNIQFQGQCYNHDQQDKHQKQIAFPFSTNDIIIVEVDIQKKYVKWTKQSTNQSFTLNIDTSKDLYPCVHFCGKCKVEILNQVFK
ncbi:unnamed protein product [Paramecium pentaurelia]|uniref:SPRY domain-containing protein n=1 Tax=Paramecium pentaurelia TaxID=43138 RepID=A0A8S1UYT6_9CILI|nr:unnamed protein product [Paramecium pentaurelia]